MSPGHVACTNQHLPTQGPRSQPCLGLLELWPGAAGFPIFVGAVAEALVTPGELPARLGAALFGAGLGWMYCAAGRSILAPALARITFQAGAVALEALQLIG